MKIECSKNKLQEALLKLDKLTVKNPTLPILKCILFSVKDNVLKLKATNLDVGAEIEIPVKIKESGDVAIPGNIISSFISNLPDNNESQINIEGDDKKISIITKNTSTDINTYSVEDFPNIPKVSKNKNTFKISSEEIVSGIGSVFFSASNSSIKPELSSVYVYQESGFLYFVSTDSFRLSEKKIQAPEGLNDNISIIIPYKNIPLIIKLLENTNTVNVEFDNNQISFFNDNIFVTSRIINSTFPDYKQIIPNDFKTKAIVLKEDLMSCFKLNSLFSNEFRQVKFNIIPSQKIFNIETQDNHIGKNVTNLNSTLDGEDIEITFNHKYITDCFQSFDSESLSLNFSEKDKPLVIRSETNNSFRYIVMPMNK